MTTATTILTVVLVILCVSIYFNIKHGLILLKVQDSIERSLDILDERYRKIDEILTIPVFFDSVEIRQVLMEIQKCRDSVLYIANELSSIDKQNTEQNTEELESGN